MSLEAVQIVAAWLADPTSGVNALLAKVPRGAEPLPPTVTIVNEVDHGWVARNQIPEEIATAGPYLAVMQGGDASWQPVPQRADGATVVAEGQVGISIVYMRRESDTPTGVGDAKHTMRAARGSLWLLQDGQTSAAERTRNGVELVQLTALTMPAVDPERGDSLITAQLNATYDVREVAPLLTP